MAEVSGQAQRIITKLGGASFVAKAVGKDISTVNRWMYSEDKNGTGGLIPSSNVNDILDMASLLGIELTSEDWDPR